MISAKQSSSKQMGQKNHTKEQNENFEVDVDLYKIIIDVYLGSFEKTIKQIEKKHGVKLDFASDFGTSDGSVINLEESHDVPGYVAIAIKNFAEKYADDQWRAIAVLSHEAVHVATAIMHNRGIPISYENDETLAYLQEWILETILNQAPEHFDE